MAYNITATGKKADAISSLRQQAGAQLATLPSDYERTSLNSAVTDAEAKVNQFAGDDDQVAISVHGNFSQADRSLGISATCGISISKPVAAPAASPAGATFAPPAPAAPTPAATPAAAPVPGATPVR